MLLDLSDIPQVRQRIGRIKGCVVMLVTLRNAHESGTEDDADKLLDILSSNPQNVLLMAEAGYFRPLIHYLKQGTLHYIRPCYASKFKLEFFGGSSYGFLHFLKPF